MDFRGKVDFWCRVGIDFTEIKNKIMPRTSSSLRPRKRGSSKLGEIVHRVVNIHDERLLIILVYNHG
jgi:hypothetical protein